MDLNESAAVIKLEQKDQPERTGRAPAKLDRSRAA
jgi:hypothetical protein